VGGKELAWQQRKAASFTFTPLYCGYEFPELPPGYCPSEKFATKAVFSRRPNPITLATAMAISGAAASPNMGYHSAPAPAFLMTVFNVRLGWWLGNPRKEKGYQKSGPLNVLGRLLCELFGLTNEQEKYVYLSDGGHFENLGIYELVRRRCRFIVACDAEEDHTFGFGGLGNAIEKCRSDFGVDIDINVEPIRRPTEAGHSEWHCAIGTIHYSRVDRDGRDGILVYLKSSLTGDEPTDVLRYGAANPGFPHQSTGDQWFDESQFESYRVLGFHIAEEVFGALGDAQTLSRFTKEELFVELAEAWYPPSTATKDAFTKHTRTVVQIYDELRKNPDLDFLNEQIYPEWRVLMKSKDAWKILKPLREQLPTDNNKLKAGFYLCNSVLQLFEDAYIDLNLEDEFNHPDNRGWMNLFRHWSWAAMLRVTWAISAGIYGARFQTFCERRLGLKIGAIAVSPVTFQPASGRPGELHTYSFNDSISELASRIEEAIWKWIEELPPGSKMIADAALKVQEIAPGSAVDPNIERGKELVLARGAIQAALKARRDQPISLVTPARKDEEWFAAATIREMCRRSGVSADLKKEWAEKVASLILSHAAIIDHRFASAELEERFNPVERELMKSFFVFNPGLAASAELRRLEITPEPKATRATSIDHSLYFPFGFAILADTNLQNDPDAAPMWRRLVYFRIQDHLRRMGLARDALVEMLMQNSDLQLDLRKMDPNATEVPTERDRARFLRLFDSAKNAARQKKENVCSDDPD